MPLTPPNFVSVFINEKYLKIYGCYELLVSFLMSDIFFRHVLGSLVMKNQGFPMNSVGLLNYKSQGFPTGSFSSFDYSFFFTKSVT